MYYIIQMRLVLFCFPILGKIILEINNCLTGKGEKFPGCSCVALLVWHLVVIWLNDLQVPRLCHFGGIYATKTQWATASIIYMESITPE